MNKLILGPFACLVSAASLLGLSTQVVAESISDQVGYYGAALCKYPGYECIRVQKGQSWEHMFPDENERDLVQRINRTYNYLWAGKTIAVPKVIKGKTMFDFSPFAIHINSTKEKRIIVDQDKLAWGAYDENGELVKWGPISSGRDKCPDSNNRCNTLTGTYRIFSREDSRCKSDVFPIGRGGAKMPYCMFFHKGFALHGAEDVPGYRASHGCVRMFVRDAKWLNEEFIGVGTADNDWSGTIVIVRPITQTGKKT